MGFKGKTWEKIGRVAVFPFGDAIFGKTDQPSEPPALPSAPSPELAAEIARKDLMEKEKKRYGRRKTILVDEDLGAAPTGKKSLLGA